MRIFLIVLVVMVAAGCTNPDQQKSVASSDISVDGAPVVSVYYGSPQCQRAYDPICLADLNAEYTTCVARCELAPCPFPDPDPENPSQRCETRTCETLCDQQVLADRCRTVQVAASCNMCSDNIIKQVKACTFADVEPGGSNESVAVVPCDQETPAHTPCTECYAQSEGRVTASDVAILPALPPATLIGEQTCSCPAPDATEWTIRCKVPNPTWSILAD